VAAGNSDRICEPEVHIHPASFLISRSEYPGKRSLTTSIGCFQLTF
jgi:hypothetical protein